MQENVLAANPTSNIRVYAVWLPVLGGDERGAWDGGMLSDPRVVHYWDPGRVVSTWFGDHVVQEGSLVWDAYFLFDQRARWADAAPVSWGATIIDLGDRILADVSRLLAA